MIDFWMPKKERVAKTYGAHCTRHNAAGDFSNPPYLGLVAVQDVRLNLHGGDRVVQVLDLVGSGGRPA